jgi:2-hydroxycyclohexanecarboxyl-CoA dehydrogenase
MDARTLVGRRAFVTGGASGIGEAIVRRLSAQGADVVFTSRNLRVAQTLAKEAGATAVRLDVTDLEATHLVVREQGPFDILVNNAGLGQRSYFTHTTMAEWRHWLCVNLESVLATTHAALPPMQTAGFGRIINIASEAGRFGSKGAAVYAAAKGGVIAFTKSIARENGRKGITANTICPGPVDTPMMALCFKVAAPICSSPSRSPP